MCPDTNHTLGEIPPATCKQILRFLYSQWEKMTAAENFACQRGCADCCTQSVTATTLEVDIIRDHFEKSGAPTELAGLLARTGRSQPRKTPTPLLTTNEFVHRYLSGNPPDEDSTDGGWDYAPCPFLRDQACSIYPVRPFGCRAFASVVVCGSTGQAVVPPAWPAMMTVIMQLIEHLDAGKPWGNFLDLLTSHATDRGHTFALSMRLPGFLLAENERPAIDLMLATLANQPVAGKTIGEWLNAV